MASDESTDFLAQSGVTMHSDSEQYSPGEEQSTSPPSSGSPVILYQPPTAWSLMRGAAINLILPFINGMMLGFGELFAHEAAFRLGWGGTKVRSRSATDHHVEMAKMQGFQQEVQAELCIVVFSNRAPADCLGLSDDTTGSTCDWTWH